MQTSEVLNQAADLIEERGWTTGNGWILPEAPANSNLCLEGALQAAAGITVTPDEDGILDSDRFAELYLCPAYRAVQTYLGRTSWLFTWNDTGGRTAVEVIEVLRACAVIEQSREHQPVAAVS